MPRPTPAQDRQSRAQPPLSAPPPSKGKSRAPASGSSNPVLSSSVPIPTPPTDPGKPESFEDRDRKEYAARVLDSWEMLARFGISRGESIPQTRLRFEKILAGIADEDDSANEDEWEDENEVEWKEALEPAAAVVARAGAKAGSAAAGVGVGVGAGRAVAKRSRGGKENEKEKEGVAGVSGSGSAGGRKGRRG